MQVSGHLEDTKVAPVIILKAGTTLDIQRKGGLLNSNKSHNLNCLVEYDMEVSSVSGKLKSETDQSNLDTHILSSFLINCRLITLKVPVFPKLPIYKT